jgi:hypothetical protein
MGSSSAQRRAQRAAEQAEAERQAQIRAATERIDAAFGSPARQRQYDDFLGALRDYYTQDAQRQKVIADRNQRFALARSGLTGGSAAVDAGRTLRDEYNRGILSAERQAQGALSDLMAQDQQSRLNLIQLAQSGADAATTAQNAANAMRVNIAGAQSSARAQGLGDIFGGTADLYRRQQEAAERRRGQTAPLGTLYGNAFGGR